MMLHIQKKEVENYLFIFYIFWNTRTCQIFEFLWGEREIRGRELFSWSKCHQPGHHYCSSHLDMIGKKTDLHFHAALCKNDVILIKIKKIFSSYPIWSPCFKLEIYQMTIGLPSLFSEKAIFFRFFGIEWNSIKELFCWAHLFCFYSF